MLHVLSLWMRFGVQKKGTIKTWGGNPYSITDDTPSGSGFVQVEPGWYWAQALDDQGNYHGWGRGSSYSRDADKPTGKVIKLGGGWWNHPVLMADGSLYNFGWAGGFTVPSGNDFMDVAGGYYHHIALRKDGTIEVWGANDDENQISSQYSGSDVVDIAAGYDFLMVLKDDGSIHQWGRALSQSPPNSDYVKIAAGYRLGMGLRENNEIDAWGYDRDGIVGSMTTKDYWNIGENDHVAVGIYGTNGNLDGWGDSSSNVYNMPAGNGYFQAVTGNDFGLALYK